MRRRSRRGTSICSSISPRTCSARPGDPGARRPRAGNVNTIDEVPDSSWFTNRILARPVSHRGSVARSADGRRARRRARGRSIRPKQAGFAPGFTMRDAKGDLWFVSFDANGFPEAATGAILVANKIFWTLGYWQVENFLVSVRPDQLVDRGSATVHAAVRQGAADAARATSRTCCSASQRSADGSYRAIAARARPGRPLGGFRLLRHAPRRSERRRAARAPARAARAQGLRRLDESRRHEGRQHARRAGHRERPRRRSATTCRTSARRSAPAPTRRTNTTKAGNPCSRASWRGSASYTLRLLVSALADGGVREEPGDRPVRGRGVRSRRAGSRACRRPRSCGRETTTRSGRRAG